MTKPKFDIWSPLPGSENAPVITAEQMSNFLYNHIGNEASKKIADAINGTNTPDFYGALQANVAPPKEYKEGFEIGSTVYYCGPESCNRDWCGEPIRIVKGGLGLRGAMISQPHRIGAFLRQELTTDITKATKAKPKRLPIERPVRMKDVEPGDILLYCGVVEDHESWPVIGSKVVVVDNKYSGGSGITYSCITKQGAKVSHQGAPGHCVAQGFSFVRRPFKAGEAVRYKADATKAIGWDGALLVDTSEADRPESFGVAVINHKGMRGSISASDLERIL
jgi:hypothetical protein